MYHILKENAEVIFCEGKVTNWKGNYLRPKSKRDKEKAEDLKKWKSKIKK